MLYDYQIIGLGAMLICGAGDIHGAIDRFYDDVLTFEISPAGIQFRHHRRGAGYVSEAAGLDTLLGRVRPQVCLFGHHHARVDAEVAGIRCIGLNKIACPGNLVAIDIDSGPRTCSVLAEYAAPDQDAKRLEALEELTRLSQERGLGY